MEAVNTPIMQNNKIKHTFSIHRLLRPPSCKHAHSRGAAANFQALYLLHRVIHSERRHMTFCKQLNRTFLLSSLTRPVILFGKCPRGDYLEEIVPEGEESGSPCRITSLYVCAAVMIGASLVKHTRHTDSF